MHAMLKYDAYYDVYLLYLPCYPYMMVWIWVDILRHAVIFLDLVYLIVTSWMIIMDVVIHLMRCGLAIVFRCQGLSKVRCGEEG
jgi:hypothetical protein